MNLINPTAQELKDRLKAIAEKSGKLSKANPQPVQSNNPAVVQPGQTSTGGTIGGQ